MSFVVPAEGVVLSQMPVSGMEMAVEFTDGSFEVLPIIGRIEVVTGTDLEDESLETTGIEYYTRSETLVLMDGMFITDWDMRKDYGVRKTTIRPVCREV